jgi:hypothetical protein
MRPMPVLLSRIRCGLHITEEETAAVEVWIEERKKSRARFENGMFIAILVLPAIAMLITWLKS